MHQTHAPRRDNLTLVVRVEPWKLATGHRRLPRGGSHRDRRRPPRGSARVALRKSLEG
jgi:hypothetical protein